MRTASPIPSREARVAVRKMMLALSARRQHPGSGSLLYELMAARRPSMDWWRQPVAVLAKADVQVAVAGGVAANAYMPPRFTADLDLALKLADLITAGEALRAAGWAFIGELDLYEDLRGSAWKDRDDHELDLIGLPGGWGRAAIEEAQTKTVSGLPTLTLPFVIVLKLISARPQDTADISRMSGAASKAALDRVRVVVGRYRPRDLEDLEQMIWAGELEYGAANDSGPAPAGRCRVCGRPLKSAASLRAGVGPECAQKEARHRP